jgi:hypothetical protein
MEPDDITDEVYDMVKRYTHPSIEYLPFFLPLDSHFRSPHAFEANAVCCLLLRQLLLRSSYAWYKHPDCSFYNGDIGCLMLQPIFIPHYKDGVEFPDLFDFLIDFDQFHQDQGQRDAGLERNHLYKILNEAIGGPTGKKVRICF